VYIECVNLESSIDNYKRKRLVGGLGYLLFMRYVCVKKIDKYVMLLWQRYHSI